MSSNRSDVRVGLFVMIVLAVAAYMVFSISGNPFSKTFTLNSHYNRVSGVKRGTTVTLAGHHIGEVQRVLPRPDLRKVEVQMAIQHEYEGAILSDATASIVPLGFLGDVMIELTYGKYGVPVRDGDNLEGSEPLDLQSLIRNTAGEFKKVLTSVNQVVGNEEYQQDLGKILDNLSVFTETLNNLVVPEDKEGLDQLFDLLRDTSTRIGDAAETLDSLIKENRENLTASVGNVKVITEQVKDQVTPDFSEAARAFSELSTKMTTLTEKIDAFVTTNSESASKAITEIGNSAQSLRETLASARTSLERIERGPGTLHDIVYKEETGQELRGALRSARGFFDQFSGLGSGLDLKISAESKWFFDDGENEHTRGGFSGTIYPPPPGIDYGGRYDVWSDVDQNRLEWDLAGQVFLGDYGLLLGVDDVGTDPDLDLLFLGKIPNTGGRLVGGFGVLEGEAGARLEAFLIPDLLSLRLDAIGFTTEDKGRMDLSMRAQVWENIHLIGGFEGLAGETERRGFVGVRYQFGKKFGSKKDVPDGWEPKYDSSTYDQLFDSPPPVPTQTTTPPAPVNNPFADDESAWQERRGNELIPVEKAPVRKP